MPLDTEGWGSVLRLWKRCWVQYRLALSSNSKSEFHRSQTIGIPSSRFQFRIPTLNVYIQTQPYCFSWVQQGYACWNLVHVAHLVNSKACTIIVPYCQDKERLPCLNMGVSYHSKIDACERKGDC
jgi:hypothetical protein